jgi:hypothetical protein
MTIPKTIKLIGKTIKIEFVKKINKKDDMGQYDSDKGLIKICAGMSEDDTKITFLHEVNHAIMDILGESTLFKRDSFMDYLAQIYYQVIQQIEED